ncbi:MAG: hypothetical protein AAFQ00_10280, partial [Pseudomonadota bacterium]
MTDPESLSLSIEKTLNRNLGPIVGAVIVMAAMASLIVTLNVFGEGIHAQLLLKAAAAGDLMRRDISAALELGIPFGELRGLEALAAQVASDTPEIARIEVIEAEVAAPVLPQSHAFDAQWIGLIPGMSDAAQKTVLQQPIMWNDAALATLMITLDQAFFAEQMRDVFFDTLIILIVTILVAVELMAYLTGRVFLGPLRMVQTALSARASGSFPQYRHGKGAASFSWVVAA